MVYDHGPFEALDMICLRLPAKAYAVGSVGRRQAFFVGLANLMGSIRLETLR